MFWTDLYLHAQTHRFTPSQQERILGDTRALLDRQLRQDRAYFTLLEYDHRIWDWHLFPLHVIVFSAGGWGDPLEHDVAAVLRDARNELLSPAKAAADYGVIVDIATWTVDAPATARRRDEIRRARGWTSAPKVQWHDPVPAAQAAE